MRLSLLSLSLAVLFSFHQASYSQESKEATSAKSDDAVAVHGTIKVDGEIEDAWKEVPELSVKKLVRSESTLDEEKVAKATVKLMWDAENIYALFQVKDSKLSDSSSNDYEQDSIEFFIDELNQKAGTYQEDDGQYRVSYKGKISGDGAGYSESKIKAAAKETEGGYVVELSVKLEKAKLEAGAKLGVELQVNDDPGTGSRGGITKWNHDENDSYLDTKNFGVVTLK